MVISTLVKTKINSKCLIGYLNKFIIPLVFTAIYIESTLF